MSPGALLENSRIEVVLAKPVDKTEYQRYARQKLAFPSQVCIEIKRQRQMFYKSIRHTVCYVY